MKVIGVTGGTGSGKSTVSQILRDLGAWIIDADRVAREVTRKGQAVLDELVQCFGPDILGQDGELNRKKLAEIAFSSVEQIKRLNAVTHKYIIARIVKELNDLKASGNVDTIVLDVPIPVEKGFMDMVDEVWVVVADREKRIKRIMARSGMGLEEAEARINAQWKDEEYLRIADKVVHNEGSVEDLEKEVVRLYYDSRNKGGI